MKNTIIVILIVVVLLIVFGVIEEYGLINWNWKKLAIGGAAVAGPFQYIRNKLNDKREEKDQIEQQLKFKTIEYKEFRQRENAKRVQPERNTNNQINETSGNKPKDNKSINGSEEFEINQVTHG